jgi:hypothetical protein
MMQKIKTSDVDRAMECAKWLVQHVGQTVNVQGSSIRSEGWRLWAQASVGADGRVDPPVYIIEVNDHVDDDTQLLFALKWS